MGIVSRRQMLTTVGLVAAGSAAAGLTSSTAALALATGSSTTIQEMIDALPADGGVVTIPAGMFVGPRLNVRDGVILQGQGWNTVIPPIVESFDPRFRIALRDLAVDWNNITIDIPPVQYGIDWRNISNGGITNVKVSGGTHGLLVDFSAQGNVFTGLVAEATEVAVELYGVDMSGPFGNTFAGGRFTAPTPLILRGSCQANGFFGIILEGPGPQVIDRQVDSNTDQCVACFALLPNGQMFPVV